MKESAAVHAERRNLDGAEGRRLSDLLEDEWRPGEWDPRRRVLVLRSEQLRVGQQCAVAGCSKRTRLNIGVCHTCRRVFEASGEPALDTWLADAVRDRPMRGGALKTCVVPDCERTRATRGLCRTHHGRWLKVREPRPPLEDWALSQQPLVAQPPCLVPSCDRQQELRKLCAAHYGNWLKERHEEPQVWARRQHPVRSDEALTFASLPDQVLTEVLFTLQQRDREGKAWDPMAVRGLVRSAEQLSISSVSELDIAQLPHSANSLLRFANDRIQLALTDPEQHAVEDLWDLRVMGMVPPGSNRNKPCLLDLSVVRQGWLRDATKRWLRTLTARSTGHWRDVVRAAAMLSSTAPSEARPSAMGRIEIDTLLREVNALSLSGSTKAKLVANAANLLDSIHLHRWVPALPPEFRILPTDRRSRSRRQDVDDDLTGRAVPESIIDQLNRHIGALTEERQVRTIVDLIATELRRLAYLILRDTGRRRGEVQTLKCACVERDAHGNPSLIYDNHKAKRVGRRLPITDSLAREIERVAALVVAMFPDVDPAALPLFPSPKRRGHKVQSTTSIDRWLRAWITAIPELIDGTQIDGELRLYDKSGITAHAFRHSYAQRLADSGVEPDVLRDLMDHTSLEITQGYYRVSTKRRREAIAIVSQTSIDNRGMPSPTDPRSYSVEAVAVPYGNCKEPQNVAAGGSACPIRFQCAGCGWYRPDPSYLPAIESHIAELLISREDAVAADADAWVLQALDSEVAAYRQIATTMKDQLEALDPEQRALVDSACRDLRKYRAATAVPVQIGPKP